MAKFSVGDHIEYFGALYSIERISKRQYSLQYISGGYPKGQPGEDYLLISGWRDIELVDKHGSLFKAWQH